MSAQTLAILIPAVAAIGAALMSYLAATRRLSGKIQDSEAASLWEESASIREDYRQRIAHAEERQAALEGRVATLEDKNTQLMEQNLQLREQNVELRVELERAQGELRRVKEDCDALGRENESLKTTIRRYVGHDDTGS